MHRYIYLVVSDLALPLEQDSELLQQIFSALLQVLLVSMLWVVAGLSVLLSFEWILQQVLWFPERKSDLLVATL
jgi:hypothetical protein